MKYNDLNIEANKSVTRVGRGIAAGQGKTAGRGTKGQKSRTGKKLRPGFEGGQNPLMQRMPKLRGFRSFKQAAETVYTGQLDKLTAKITDAAALAEAGLVSSQYVRIKLVLRGEVTKKLDVKLQGASAGAIEAIQKAGGSFEKVAQNGRPVTSEKKKDNK